MKLFPVEIITPTGPVYKDEVDSLIIPGSEGAMGVLAGHAPLLARLKAGPILVRKGAEEKKIISGPGFVEVLPGRVIVLVDTAQLPDAKQA